MTGGHQGAPRARHSVGAGEGFRSVSPAVLGAGRPEVGAFPTPGEQRRGRPKASPAISPSGRSAAHRDVCSEGGVSSHSQGSSAPAGGQELGRKGSLKEQVWSVGIYVLSARPALRTLRSARDLPVPFVLTGGGPGGSAEDLTFVPRTIKRQPVLWSREEVT